MMRVSKFLIVIVLSACGRVDFRVERAKEGLPPYVTSFVVQLERSVEVLEGLFVLEPEVRIAGYRRIGKKEILVLLGEPLEPGHKYTLRAASGSGLSGKVELSVRPLELTYDPLPHIGPQGRPAILFTANGPIAPAAQKRLLKVLPADLEPEWLPLSTPERGLVLLSKSAQSISFASYEDAALRIAGGRVDLPAKAELPFEVREAALEAVEGRYRLRLTCSHDPSSYAAQLAYYLRIGPRAIAYTTEVQGVDVLLNLQEAPTEPVQVEILRGFPGGGVKVLSETRQFLLPLPRQEQLAWHQPYVHFLSPGTPIVFWPDGSDQLEVSLWRVRPENVRLFFRQRAEMHLFDYPRSRPGEEEWDFFSGYDDYYGWYTPPGMELEVYAELVYRGRRPKETFTKVGKKGRVRYAFAEGLEPGVYWVEIAGRGTIQNWFVVSSYALLARQGSEGVTMWAVEQESGKPLSGVKVELWGPAGQSLARGRTDRQGQAFLAYTGSVPAEGIWAQKEGQGNYLSLRGLRPGRWAFETEGVPSDPKRLLLYMQPGRTLFRPGDTLRLAGFVRTQALRYPGELPLRLHLYDARGRLMTQADLRTDPEGFWEWNWPLPPNAPTGNYQLQVFRETPFDSDRLGELALQVEFFQPYRLSLSVSTRPQRDKLATTVQALFLYGAPGSYLTGSVDVRYRPTTPSHSLAAGYLWQVEVPQEQLEKYTVTASLQLDAAGIGRVELPLPRGWGYLTAVPQARVLDDEGRPTHAATPQSFLSQPVLVGMQRLPRFVESGKPVEVALLALSGEPLQPHAAPVTAQVRILYRRYEYTLVQNPWGGYRYEYRPIERRFAELPASLREGRGSFSFTPRESGEYVIQLWAPGQAYPIQQTVDAWAWGGQGGLRADPEGWIEIEPQQPSYTPGEKARLLLKLPIEGRVLVTLEREKVFYSTWVESEGRVASVELPLRPEFAPGVYVHALAIHRTEGGELPFRTSRGMMYLPITPAPIKVEVQAPEKALPGSTLTVRVRCEAPKARIVLAGVDKGLLLLQRSEVGSPHDFFYQKRAYGLSVSEQLPYSAPWGSRLIGGGDYGVLAPSAEVDLSEREEQALAFLWTDLRADSKGEATLQVRLPAFTGQIRWRAYALAEDRYGMGEAYTTCATPVIARLSLPHFVRAGDALVLPLRLRNTTQTPQSGSWTLSSEHKNLQFSPSEGSFALGPGEQKVVYLTLEAQPEFRHNRVRLQAGGHLLQEKVLRVLPAARMHRSFKAYVVPPGESVALTVPGTAYIGAERRVRLISASFPIEGAVQTVAHLIAFPHGCGEQITSRALAVLAAASWVQAVTGISPDSAKAYVLAALQKLAPLQTPEGAFSYWPGSPADDWLSVYVTHFLYLAQSAGYLEAKPLFEKALSYQKSRLRQGMTQDFVQAFRAFTLARIEGKGIASALPSVAQIGRVPDPTARALWRAAFSLAGLPLPPAPARVFFVSQRELGGWLRSFVRDRALLLYAESFVPEAARWPSWQAELRNLRGQIAHLSTQESAWVLLALALEGSRGVASAQLRVGGTSRSLPGGLSGLDLTASLGQEGTLRNLSATDTFYVVLIAEGIPLEPLPPQSAGMGLRTAFRGPKGEPLTPNALKPGMRFSYVIQVEALDEGRFPMENIALTVSLPAGWQAENPRLLPKEADDLPPFRGLGLVYADYREDELRYYFTLTERRAQLVLPMQVVQGGQYLLPSVQVEALYDPTLGATTAAQSLTLDISRVP